MNFCNILRKIVSLMSLLMSKERRDKVDGLEHVTTIFVPVNVIEYCSKTCGNICSPWWL